MCICNTLFILTAGFGFGQLGGYAALAAWAGLQTMPADLFPLVIEYICYPSFMPYFAFEEVLGRYRALRLMLSLLGLPSGRIT